ncbi:uncharacterized protein LOC135825893 [Sycon ciliatum]|uniref:uncharacterized protein LOC135825893 n=1 Tax=Sycon ciliatum TaxID=27933 RepID=UPI0031F6D8A5
MPKLPHLQLFAVQKSFERDTSWQAYIGLSRSKDGTWRWADGTEFNTGSRNWRAGLGPQRVGAECAVLGAPDNTLMAVPCVQVEMIICELDIDECKKYTGTASLCTSSQEQCVNTHASYTCECKPFYIRDNDTCVVDLTRNLSSDPSVIHDVMVMVRNSTTEPWRVEQTYPGANRSTLIRESIADDGQKRVFVVRSHTPSGNATAQDVIKQQFLELINATSNSSLDPMKEWTKDMFANGSRIYRIVPATNLSMAVELLVKPAAPSSPPTRTRKTRCTSNATSSTTPHLNLKSDYRVYDLRCSDDAQATSLSHCKWTTEELATDVKKFGLFTTGSYEIRLHWDIEFGGSTISLGFTIPFVIHVTIGTARTATRPCAGRTLHYHSSAKTYPEASTHCQNQGAELLTHFTPAIRSCVREFDTPVLSIHGRRLLYIPVRTGCGFLYSSTKSGDRIASALLQTTGRCGVDFCLAYTLSPGVHLLSVKCDIHSPFICVKGKVGDACARGSHDCHDNYTCTVNTTDFTCKPMGDDLAANGTSQGTTSIRTTTDSATTAGPFSTSAPATTQRLPSSPPSTRANPTAPPGLINLEGEGSTGGGGGGGGSTSQVGLIIGIVVGLLALVLIVSGVWICYQRRKNARHRYDARVETEADGQGESTARLRGTERSGRPAEAASSEPQPVDI